MLPVLGTLYLERLCISESATFMYLCISGSPIPEPKSVDAWLRRKILVVPCVQDEGKSIVANSTAKNMKAKTIDNVIRTRKISN